MAKVWLGPVQSLAHHRRNTRRQPLRCRPDALPLARPQRQSRLRCRGGESGAKPARFITVDALATGGTTGLLPNPNEKQPQEDGSSVSFEREVMSNMAMRVSGIYSRRFNIPREQFSGQPYEAFSIPITRPDPGPDGRVGTGDDQGRSSHTTSNLARWPDSGFRTTMWLPIPTPTRHSRRSNLRPTSASPGGGSFRDRTWRRNSTFRFLRVVPSLPMKKFLAQITRGSGWAGCRPRTYSRPTLRCRPTSTTGAGQPRRDRPSSPGHHESILGHERQASRQYGLPNQNLMDVRVQKAFRLGKGAL